MREMTDAARERRIGSILNFVKEEHFRYRAFARIDSGTYRFASKAYFWVDAPKTPLVTGALENFQVFLRRCFEVSLEEAPGGDIVFSLGGEGAQEAFTLDVGPKGISVIASHERGLLQATHAIERLMADAGGPFLEFGRRSFKPTLSPRFTEGIFIPGMQEPRNPGNFPDEYLGLMSHFGANALKVYVNLFHIWRAEALPELDSPEWKAETEALRQFARKIAAYGMDLYLHLNAGPLSVDHPVFSNHPEVKGSRVEIAVEELSGRDWYALCSSQPTVRHAYGQAVSAIFQEVPELAGAIVIVGGECFFHCFTRPAGVNGGETNCPHCQGSDAHRHVAALVNCIGGAMPSGKRLMAWPYSAFIWSPDDSSQSRWIRDLSPKVEVLSNFDCFDEDVAGGAGARFFDYNIKLIGPSSVFQAQRDICMERKLKIHVKTETTTTPDAFFLPYLPLYFRWYERFKAIRESGASGFMGQWRFYGMTGSIPEELQYHSVWSPQRTADDLLSTIARRDFGLNEADAMEVVEAWRILSQSWDAFPYSAMTSGEREGYMRGPWYLGPAHPLIFNPQSRYHLGAEFFALRGDLAELASKEEIAAMPGKPRYIDDLWTCIPFGPEAYLKLTRECLRQWSTGLAKLKRVIGNSANGRAQMECDVCEIINIHLQTLANTVEFLWLRDEIARKQLDESSLDQILTSVVGVIDAEVANAERALPILARDPRIGFGFTYGPVYDRKMVEEKIRQCREVKDSEIPRIRSFLRFHLWQK